MKQRSDYQKLSTHYVSASLSELQALTHDDLKKCPTLTKAEAAGMGPYHGAIISTLIQAKEGKAELAKITALENKLKLAGTDMTDDEIAKAVRATLNDRDSASRAAALGVTL